nr:MAG TPA: hypothetical protein [Bacteriophage sp.]
MNIEFITQSLNSNIFILLRYFVENFFNFFIKKCLIRYELCYNIIKITS